MDFSLIVLFFIVSAGIVRAEFLENWMYDRLLPYSMAHMSAVSYESNLLLFNGSNALSSSHDEILIATQSGSLGNLSSWIWNSKTPEKLIYQNVVRKDNDFYSVGGFYDQMYGLWKSTNSVNHGKIDNLFFDHWDPQFLLPEKLALGKATIIGDWLYYAGGFTSYSITSNWKNEIYKAKINSDGSLGIWSLAGTLPEPMCCFGIASKQNNLIIFIEMPVLFLNSHNVLNIKIFNRFF